MKEITTLKAALKILKKGHKPCKTFSIQCGVCQRALLIELLEEAIETQEWLFKIKNINI